MADLLDTALFCKGAVGTGRAWAGGGIGPGHRSCPQTDQAISSVVSVKIRCLKVTPLQTCENGQLP